MGVMKDLMLEQQRLATCHHLVTAEECLDSAMEDENGVSDYTVDDFCPHDNDHESGCTYCPDHCPNPEVCPAHG